MDLLKGKFGEHFISRSGPINQSSRSCDFTPLDYFLWDYVKAHVYTDKPASIHALKENNEAIIPAELLERVYQNWTKRMDRLKRSCAQHSPEIIFKH